MVRLSKQGGRAALVAVPALLDGVVLYRLTRRGGTATDHVYLTAYEARSLAGELFLAAEGIDERDAK